MARSNANRLWDDAVKLYTDGRDDFLKTINPNWPSHSTVQQINRDGPEEPSAPSESQSTLESRMADAASRDDPGKDDRDKGMERE